MPTTTILGCAVVSNSVTVPAAEWKAEGSTVCASDDVALAKKFDSEATKASMLNGHSAGLRLELDKVTVGFVRMMEIKVVRILDKNVMIEH